MHGDFLAYPAARMSTLPVIGADLDDTLLPTTAADAKALQDVAALLAGSHPDVQWDAVHAAWKTAFGKAPWDKEHKVCMKASKIGAHRSCSQHGGHGPALCSSLGACSSAGGASSSNSLLDRS